MSRERAELSASRIYESRDRSVGIVTGYELDDLVVEVRVPVR
jgi:hypothetical protein